MRNSKRQTVWLVSMLGLMVVLSAYYLFTDPAKDLQTAGDNNDNEATIDISGTAVDPETILDEIGVTGENAKTDEEIIAEYEANETMGQQDFFMTSYMGRMESFNEQFEELYQVIDDPNVSDADLHEAYKTIGKLEEQQNMLINLEEQIIANNYEDVHVESDGEGNYVVYVQAEKIEKSEFVSIMDLVLDELDAKPADIQVEYVS